MKHLFIFIFVCTFLHSDGYDPSFSTVIDDLYAEYHAYPGDWCDELALRIHQITEKKGESVSYLELKQEGIDEDYLDAMAIAYCKKHPDAYTAIIWPRMKYEHEPLIFSILTKRCQVAYKKKFILKNNGPAALMLAIPEKVPHVAKHFREYFPRGMSQYPMICYVLRAPTHRTTLQTKRNLRGLMDIKPYCIHMNDTHEQGMDIARLLLNNNSIHFLNNHTKQSQEEMRNSLDKYEAFLKEKKITEREICVGAEGVLAAYGVKKGDIDFLSTHPDVLQKALNPVWEKQGFSTLDILYNPKNFFYHRNHKFVNLASVQKFKRQAQEKDDAEKIETLLDPEERYKERCIAFLRSFFRYR